MHHLVKRLSRTLQTRIDIIPTAVIEALQRRDWPGNIRELENVLYRAIILSPDTTLSLTEGWMPGRGSAPSAGLVPLVDLDRRHIQRVLEAVDWRIEGSSGAARVLGMHPSTLRSRMSKLGIQRPRWTCTDDPSESASRHCLFPVVGRGERD